MANMENYNFKVRSLQWLIWKHHSRRWLLQKEPLTVGQKILQRYEETGFCYKYVQVAMSGQIADRW